MNHEIAGTATARSVQGHREHRPFHAPLGAHEGHEPSAFRFDKTVTLTSGDLTVVGVAGAKGVDEVLRLGGGVESTPPRHGVASNTPRGYGRRYPLGVSKETR